MWLLDKQPSHPWVLVGNAECQPSPHTYRIRSSHFDEVLGEPFVCSQSPRHLSPRPGQAQLLVSFTYSAHTYLVFTVCQEANFGTKGTQRIRQKELLSLWELANQWGNQMRNKDLEEMDYKTILTWTGWGLHLRGIVSGKTQPNKEKHICGIFCAPTS